MSETPSYWCPPCQAHVEAKHTLSGMAPHETPNTTCPHCVSDLIRDDDRDLSDLFSKGTIH